MNGVKLLNSVTLDICINDMKDGQIGVITSWPSASGLEYKGRIVQRVFKIGLISIGYSCFYSWGESLFDSRMEMCRVRILESGEQIVIN